MGKKLLNSINSKASAIVPEPHIALRQMINYLNAQSLGYTIPSVNYAKDWVDQLFLFPGPV